MANRVVLAGLFASLFMLLIIVVASLAPATDFSPVTDAQFETVFGFTFAYASKFLICVLDLHPLSRDREYMDKYIEPLKDVSKQGSSNH